MKTCKHCKLQKSIDSFPRNKSYKSGYCNTCKKCRKQMYPHSESTKQKAYERQIKRNYGITLEDYHRMYENQDGVCAGCKQPSEVKFHIDHDHHTGRVRGLLCGNCNKALGLLHDNPNTLKNLIEYLND